MSNEQLPRIASPASIKVQVSAGQKYLWCQCGLSKAQPFCDGSHAGTGFTPIPYQATEDRLVGFCGCKHTKSGPLCDGTHRNLTTSESL